MNLRQEDDGDDTEVRDIGRKLVRDWYDGRASAFYRLYDDIYAARSTVDVPARKVRREISAILEKDGEAVEKDRARLERFAAYVDREVIVEDALDKVAKAARHAAVSGIDLRDAKARFEREFMEAANV
jgi:hypothetical protein